MTVSLPIAEEASSDNKHVQTNNAVPGSQSYIVPQGYYEGLCKVCTVFYAPLQLASYAGL